MEAPMLEPAVKFARNPAGLTIAYTVLGDGPPDLVWVPNFTSHIDGWRLFKTAIPFISSLAAMGRLLQFDQPGTGASDPVPPNALPTMEQWMDDVRVVMDAENVERATLIAEDSGGPVALLFSAMHPDRVERLVLINSYARMERAPDYAWGYPPEMRQKAVERWSQMWGTGEQLRITAPRHADDPETRRAFGQYERLAAAPSMARALFEMISQIDVRDILPAVRVPVLVLHCRHDPWIRVDHGRYLGAHIPGAQFVELAGDEHYAYAFGDTAEVVSRIAEFVTGMPHVARDTERILTTLLFTDIVDSTKRAVELGDRAWQSLLSQHDTAARSLVERYRGRVIKSTGDGLLATFDGPARAVRAAGAIRDATHRLGLVIRAGLHTGEVELRGDDIAGVAVHVAARVEAAAVGEEVLVSQTVKDLTIGSGILYDERGEHTLKGVPGLWRLYGARI